MVRRTSDEPLDEHLEDSGNDQGVQQANGCVIDIPERAHSDLADEEDSKGNEEGHEGSGPDGNNLITKRVSKLRVDNLAVAEGN